MARTQYGNSATGSRRYDHKQRIAQGNPQLRNVTRRNRPGGKPAAEYQSTDRRGPPGKRGELNPAEKQNINRERNGASRQIYKEKHDEKTAPR